MSVEKQTPWFNMFSRHRSRECPACGSDAVVDDPKQGHVVCTDCGVIVSHVLISDEPSFSCADRYRAPKPDPIERCELVEMVRSRHPACHATALHLRKRLPRDLRISKSEMPRYAQALAWLAYREDGQQVKMADLAGQIQVPAERLSKDIRRLSQSIAQDKPDGTHHNAQKVDVAEPAEEDTVSKPACLPEDSEDLKYFTHATLSLLNPSLLTQGVSVRTVNVWSRRIFVKCLLEGRVEVLNVAPRHQAAAAVAAYCSQADKCPFTQAAVEWLGSDQHTCKRSKKRAREESGAQTGAAKACAVIAALTHNAAARRAYKEMKEMRVVI